jgi:hypothetical protein
MWTAVQEYNESIKHVKKNDEDPVRMEAKSMQDVENYVANHLAQFQHFRHDGTRFDVIRGAIGDHLMQIQAISDVLSGPVTTGFPAAAPIFTAINFLVFTGNRVRADYDNIIDFLNEVGACMNSISIVEGFIATGRQIPQLDQDFKRVFSAVLTLCGISTTYILDGRLKRSLMRGVLGNDHGLNAAYQKLQKAMVTLGRSINNGTFANAVVLTKGMELLQDQVMEIERLVNQTLQVSNEIRDGLKDQNKPPERRIRDYFENFAFWEAPYDELKKKFVVGTEKWLLEEDQHYITWSVADDDSWGRGRSSLLWIWGGTGTGKSVLAFKAVETLKSYAAKLRGVSVAYFFFSPEKKITLQQALYSLIVQVGDYDELYAKRIASLIKDSKEAKPESIKPVAVFRRFIADQCVLGSSDSFRRRLYIVLDGIEELSNEEQKNLQEIVGQIMSEKQRKLSIKLLLLGQSELNERFGRIEDVPVPHGEYLLLNPPWI